MKESLELPKSKLITPILLPEIRSELEKLNTSHFLNYSRLDKKKIESLIKSVTDGFKQWLGNYVNVSDFQHIYPTAGISGGIENWLTFEDRLVYRFSGDYYWLSYLRPTTKVVFSVDEVDSEGILYLSNPSSIDGNYFSNWSEIINSGKKVALDLAYYGTAKEKSIQISKNVEYIFYSFSKTFGLPHLRLGWVLSRKEISSLELLNTYQYISVPHLFYTNQIISSFSPFFSYEKIKEKQLSVCNRLKVSPSDSILLGNSFEEKYSSFRREGSCVARIPLSEYY